MSVRRPRRNRDSAVLRRMVSETQVRPQDLIWPLFVTEEAHGATEIGSMPGQYRHSVESLLRVCEGAVDAGVPAVILFGIPDHKHASGKGAWQEDGAVQQALRALGDRGFPLLKITDVCLCEYTDHGHCGLLDDGGYVRNDPTVSLLAKTAVSHAQAGADMVAPSDMMDLRVGAIREAMDSAGHERVGLMSYAVKYASGFYGPFRDAAQSAPTFGDRATHQMDPANAREALIEARADVDEGADIVMVKPALAYLDIVRAVREEVNVPVAAYSVSGEYAMIEAAAANGWIDRERVILESLLSMRRAGADLILTYHAVEAAKWLGATSRG